MGGKIKTFFSLSSFIFLIILGTVTTVGAISRGYKTDDSSIKPGMVVSLSSGENTNTSSIEKATEDNAEKIIGVATTVDGETITVGSSDQNVFVESGGELKAYVSDINGSVKQGDQLTISALSGIMAEFTNGSRVTLGVALEDFPSEGYQTHEIKTLQGVKLVNIAQISVNLDTKNIVDSSKVDSSLERLGRSVVGKDVSEVRVVVALVIFLLVLFAEGGILYGAISSAITSLGRNPLAGKIIKRQLLQVSLVAFLVLTVGLAAIYLILWA